MSFTLDAAKREIVLDELDDDQLRQALSRSLRSLLNQDATRVLDNTNPPVPTKEN